ncbi:hypothetical protein ACIRD6_36285 [Streptomyces sp. NPDC102473]|uniref:hypothetical protein n=1 Tax=Streptomyces sp. NPDC102473 TaxID=3366180 RepID=UPI00381E3B25
MINESDIARQAGVPIATWRRRDAPAFRQHVPALSPDSRFLVYDLAQTQAHLEGRPLPDLPPGEHPNDLLNHEEAAALLGAAPSTVHAYATQGYLPAGTTVYSLRVWARRDIEERRSAPPRQGKGGGRPQGEGKGPRKAQAGDRYAQALRHLFNRILGQFRHCLQNRVAFALLVGQEDAAG